MQQDRSYLPLWTASYHNPKEAAETSLIYPLTMEQCNHMERL